MCSVLPSVSKEMKLFTPFPCSSIIDIFFPCVIGSNFVVSQRLRSVQQRESRSNSRTSLHMGSQAKFGVFSPAVYAAKIALGNDKLNKIRGQAISLHSQYIGDFCTWAGAYHLRTRLIKKVRCVISHCFSERPGLNMVIVAFVFTE